MWLQRDSLDTAHNYLYTLYFNITYIGAHTHTQAPPPPLSLSRTIHIFLPLLGGSFQQLTFSFLSIPTLFPAPAASF
jgi:hypothetical protein